MRKAAGLVAHGLEELAALVLDRSFGYGTGLRSFTSACADMSLRRKPAKLAAQLPCGGHITPLRGMSAPQSPSWRYAPACLS